MKRNSIICQENQGSTSTSRRKTAFTLIELLAVISIIAILAAILFPVFAQAKEAAKKTTCVSNQKQIATAFIMYTGDYDEALPTGSTDYLPNGNRVSRSYIYSYTYTTTPSFQILSYSGGLFDPYLKAFQLVGCPSAKDLLVWNRSSDARTMGLISIGYNNAALQSYFYSMSDFDAPASTLLLADGGRYLTTGAGYGVSTDGIYSTEILSNRNDQPAYFHARHGGKIVTAWCDGHAKAMPITRRDAECSPFYASVGMTKAKADANNIGWLMPPGLVAQSGSGISWAASIYNDPHMDNYLSVKKVP